MYFSKYITPNISETGHHELATLYSVAILSIYIRGFVLQFVIFNKFQEYIINAFNCL